MKEKEQVAKGLDKNNLTRSARTQKVFRLEQILQLFFKTEHLVTHCNGIYQEIDNLLDLFRGWSL